MWKDYDLDNPATWEPMEAPTVDAAWEAKLTEIGGLNPFGKPNLVWRWGATYVDPMREDGSLKYLLAKKDPVLVGFEYNDPDEGVMRVVKTMDQVPDNVFVAVPKYEATQLGQRRIIIERWRSPEFLSRTGRYRATVIRDPDKVYEFFFCRACDGELVLGEDGPLPCRKCGSKRHYVREHRFEGMGQLLRTFPREGVYDCFLVLENQHNEPLPADANTLRQIESAWYNAHHLTDQQHDDIINEMLADQIATNAQATNPSNPFMAPVAGR